MKTFLAFRTSENIIKQGVWGGGYNAYVVFVIPFLIRLGSSITWISIYIGVTSVGYLLIGPLTIIRLQNSKKKKAWLVWSCIFSRTTVAVACMAPFCGNYKASMGALVFIIFSIPANIYGALFLPIPGLLIKPQDQPVGLNLRLRMAYIGNFIANIIFTILMLLFQYPYNFMALFIVSIFFGAVEVGIVIKLDVYSSDDDASTGFMQKVRSHEIMKEKNYLIFIAMVTLMVFTVSIATPLQSVYYLRQLHFSDLWFSVWADILLLGMIVGNVLWRKFQLRYSNYSAMCVAILFAGFYYFFISISSNALLLLLIVGFAGFMNAGGELGITLTLFRLGSAARRSLMINIYAGVVLAISFFSSFFLNFFTHRYQLKTIFSYSFIFRTSSALLFLLPSMRRRFDDTAVHVEQEIIEETECP